MFKKIRNGLFTAMAATALMATNAFADGGGGVDLSGVTLDTTTVGTLAATVLTGLGVIWGIRKVIKLINRS